MKTRLFFILGIGITISTVLCDRSAVAQFEELVSKVPSSASSLVLVNVEKVMASPAAAKEDWRKNHEKAHASGITFLPPDCKTTILASQFDFELMSPIWTVAIVNLDHQPSLTMIERMTGGTVDKIGKYSAIALPGDAYLVQFAPQLIAAMSPANRQSLGRWVREVDSPNKMRLSAYLTEAFAFANDIGTPIIIALDLQDVVSEDTIREALQSNEKYAQSPSLETLVKLLASIRGITLGITLQTDAPFGKVKVDFNEKVTITPDEAKVLLLQALERRGAMLIELEDWTPKVAGNQITLEGNLTQSGMKRLASLFDRPPSFKKDAQVASAAPKPGAKPNSPPSTTPSPSPSTGSVEPTAQVTQQYFHRVLDLFNDLKKTKKGSTNYNMGQIGVWCDSYARKIDQLPILNVDPEMVEYGAFAADALRAASSSIKQSNARKRVRQINEPVPYNTYTYGNTYGYSYREGLYGGTWGAVGSAGVAARQDTRAYYANRARIGTEERVISANQARDIFAKLEETTGDMRRKMTMKYGVEF